MAYFHRMTNSEDDKQKIQAAISGSIDNMAPFCNNVGFLVLLDRFNLRTAMGVSRELV
jgi:hypothetical protein